MNSQMPAMVVHRYGPPEVLELGSLPVPVVQPNAVLVKLAAAGVNPADASFRSGRFRFLTRLPFVPGADVAGVVAAVGAQVTQFKPGDTVYTMLPVNSGGGYAGYAVSAEQELAPMPANLSFIEAAATPLAALTALQALRDKAGLSAGAHALIYGASGGVGSFAVQIAKALGAHVTGVASSRNVDFVRELGADAVIDYTQTEVTASSTSYNVIFDTIDAYSFRQWRRVLRPHGVVVSVNPIKGQLAGAISRRAANRIGAGCAKWPRFANTERVVE